MRQLRPMKKWQARGEVADSDDEDLGFNNESQSPQQHRKIPRPDQADRVESQNDTDPPLDVSLSGYGWMGDCPRPEATTYSRRANTSKLVSAIKDPIEVVASPTAFCTPSLPAKNAFTDHETQSKARTLMPNISKSSTVLTSQTNGLTTVVQPETVLRDLSKSHERLAVLQSSQSSKSENYEELPDASTLVPHRNANDTFDADQFSSSGLSSPLSELDGTPPPFISLSEPGVNIRAFQRYSQIDNDGIETDATPTSDHQLDITNIHQRPSATVEIFREYAVGSHSRRSLRARKEKQLHPYMYDKAQYQEQWKSRGLKPVHYQIADQRSHESPDGSFSEDEDPSQSQDKSVGNSSPPPNNSLFGTRFASLSAQEERINTNSASDSRACFDSNEDFPDIDTILTGQAPGVFRTGLKRRKTFQLPRSLQAKRAHEQGSKEGQQILAGQSSIPPSPPLTSSQSAQISERRMIPSASTLTVQRTPAPLPTPQISSDLRTIPFASRSPLSSLGPLSRRLQSVSSTRPQFRSHVIDSSTEHSDVESELDPDLETVGKSLRRERKRIKGVLPASWLKIDLQAQMRHVSRSPSPSPPPAHTLGKRVTSPKKGLPLKGVARRVVNRLPATRDSTDYVELMNSGDDSDEPTTTKSPNISQQQYIRQSTGHATLAPNEDVDDERMEMDWIDPMYAGSSRRIVKRVKRKSQPRITEAFQKFRDGEAGSVERNVRTKELATARGQRWKSKPDKSSRTQRPRRPPPRLSIVDAQNALPTSNSIPPLFLRLARRQARCQIDKGRQSPTQKIIRLATKDDTEEAYEVLRAWREGTIKPQQVPVAAASTQRSGTEPVEIYRGMNGSNLQQLGPMEAANIHQQLKLPSPIRENTNPSLTAQGRVPVIRRSRQQQMRLQPLVLSRPGSADHNISHAQETKTDKGVMHRDMRGWRQAGTQPQTARYRGVQLETLEDTFAREHRTTAFERRINCLTEAVIRTAHRAETPAFRLRRFLDDETPLPTPNPQVRQYHENRTDHANDETLLQKATVISKPRKHHAHHLDIEARRFRQPSEPLPETVMIDNETGVGSEQPEYPTLQGLGGFGTRYATDFDIQPLALGTFFHQSTFIGSGDFAASLNFAGRDLDTAAGCVRMQFDKEELEWGAWTEEVATGIARIPRAISGDLQSLDDCESVNSREQFATVQAKVVNMLRSTVRYCSRHLAFLDPVDRRSCVQHLRSLVEDLGGIFSSLVLAPAYREMHVQCLQYILVIANQALVLSKHSVMPPGSNRQAQQLVVSTGHQLLCNAFPTTLDQLHAFYEENKHVSAREAGIRESNSGISSLVILNHILRDTEFTGSLFWDVIYRKIDTDCTRLNSVPALDKTWYDLFAILPSLEIDATGIMRPGSRFHDTQEDWSFPKRLLHQLFKLYPATRSVRGSTINDYIRATLARCHHLITRWGWWKCESVLFTVYDFFAQRGLANLENEENGSTPKFVGELHNRPSLEVQPEDRSFHIFLKSLSAGLQSMAKRGIYTEKRVGGIAWRFIPNHGRTYPKASDVKQTEIAALRNHHDLLCTLHYASPPLQRPRLDLLRNLVDHSTSHREACRLNVRSWINLTNFQASSEESVDSLQPFMSWFRDMMQITIMQYRLARSEAETDFAIAKAQGNYGITESIFNATIASNQRQIAATMVDALAGLKRAIRAARNPDVVSYIVQHASFWTSFMPFDPSERSLFTAIEEALEVTKTALEIQRDHSVPREIESQQTNEDSQEYGDSTLLNDFVMTETTGQPSTSSVADLLHDSVGQLISNAFGADAILDDTILIKMLDVWVQLALASVLSGHKSWKNYFDDYSSNAWNQLRDTDQRQKFTPYFLSRIVEHVKDDLKGLKPGILTSWLISLVERESTLKHQHTLTTALLNYISNEPLLDNLPFSRDARTGRFNLTLRELRRRRLGLVSSVLSNMRKTFDVTMHRRSQEFQDVRRTYADMLRQLMQAMKSNYLVLQASSSGDVADPNATGAYVEFIHQIVSSLQQHTTDICRIDAFFTDSSAFPLPVTDPTYVVGRLRSYVPRLTESKTRKQLAVFVHTVSERAAIDGEQQYLVDQLCAAVDGVLERGDAGAPSLRHILLTAIFPAYVGSALSTSCSWILAIPILQAGQRIVRSQIYNTMIDDPNSVDAVLETVHTFVESLLRPLKSALTHHDLLEVSGVQKVVGLVFEAAKPLLTLGVYIQKTRHHTNDVDVRLRHLHICAKGVQARFIGAQASAHDQSMYRHLDFDDDVSSDNCWPDTTLFARKQVQDALHNDWYSVGGQYFVKRGNTCKEVVVSVSDDDRERRGLLRTIDDFCQSWDAITDGKVRRQREACDDDLDISRVMV